jgi:hypothetical protein
MSIPISLLIAHFIGDFVLQSDWMATNKSKRFDALILHVGCYIIPFALMTPHWFSAGGEIRALTFLVLTIALHMAQDGVTSQINARLWFFQREVGIWEQASYTMPKHGRTLVNPWTPIDGKRHWFFVAIGADQLLHFVLLAGTLELMR